MPRHGTGTCQKRSHQLAATFVICLMVLPPTSAALDTTVATPRSPPTSPSPGDVRDLGTMAAPAMGFLENAGQLPDREVLYYARGSAGGIAMTRGGAMLTLVGPEGLGCNVELAVAGATGPTPYGRDPLPWPSHFLIGDDPAGWQKGVRGFREVVYGNVLEGVDLVYRTGEGGLKYEFIVRPGSDVADIAVQVTGHKGLRVSDEGDLVISTVAGDAVDSGLAAYYLDAPREGAPCAFEVRGPDIYGFRVDGRDPSRTLVIDPLVYSTYIGGSDGVWDIPWGGIAVDGDGKAYVVGISNSTDFPTTPGAFQTSNAGGNGDVVVLRLDEDGGSLEFSTFVGGTSASEAAFDLEVDGSGRAVVVGQTRSNDFPTTGGVVRTSHPAGDADGFAFRLSADGSSLEFSTYLGGSGTDSVNGLDLGPGGAVFAAGYTQSTDLPATQGAFQNESAGGSFDGFVCKMAADGTSLSYMTYLGGRIYDSIEDVAVDQTGHAYVTGQTGSNNFPVTTGTLQDELGGRFDAFVTKLEPDGSDLVYSTYLGGNMDDEGTGIEVDGQGTAYIGGDTASASFPTINGSFQVDLAGGYDAFVCNLAANGSALVYSTLIGGTDLDTCEGFALLDDGTVLMTGRTASSDYPILGGVFQSKHAGSVDAVLVKIDDNGSSLLYSSFLGGRWADAGLGIAFDGNADAYVTGTTFSDDFPVTSGGLQRTHAGAIDVFVVKVELSLDLERPIARPGSDLLVDQFTNVTFNGTASTDNVGVVNWTWSFTYNGSEVRLYGPVAWWVFDIPGLYTVILEARDAANNTGTGSFKLRVRDIIPPVARAPSDIHVQQHWSVTFDGSRSSDNVGIVEWRWTFYYGDRDLTLEGQKATHVFDLAGVFNVTLNVTDADGNWDTDGLTVNVTDITDPVADAGEDVTVNQHETVTFNGTGSSDNAGIAEMTWSYLYDGEYVIMSGPEPGRTFDIVGIYDVQLLVLDAMGNRDTDFMRVVVRDITPPAAVAGDDLVLDERQSITLDGSESYDNVRINSWNWTVEFEGMAVNFTGEVTYFTFAEAGVYNVTLVVVDPVGLSSTDDLVVTVRDITHPTADAGEYRTVNQGKAVTFDGTASSDNVGVTSWNWTVIVAGEIHNLSGPSIEFTFEEVGVHRVVLKVADAVGHEDVDEITVTVIDKEPPVPRTGPPQTIRQYEHAALNGSASTDNVGVTSWTWTFNHNMTHVTLRGKVHSYRFELPGNYTITLNVTDSSGNSATTTTWVLVESDEVPDVTVAAKEPDYRVLLIAGLVLLVVVIAVVAYGVHRRRRWSSTADWIRRPEAERPAEPEEEADAEKDEKAVEREEEEEEEEEGADKDEKAEENEEEEEDAEVGTEG